ncbi:MAG: methionyl-tRNA formyltransferase [Selenomonadaceae bacterium]|nr:methionyl-tRNA formyltransferase [Selenomonadaceae bacterium]
MKDLRILFMGTPDFAIPSLKMLTEETNVVAVVTQPDKPKGRGHKLMPPPVKIFAEEKSILVYQPQKVREPEFIEKLKELAPDVIIVVAFGQILPEEILNFPKYGCVNVHGSLLPAYRGAAPIEWSIINGEKKTGVTTMFMAAGLDTGDMLLKEEVEISEDETADELRAVLSEIGAKVLKQTLLKMLSGELKREVQDDSKSSYASRIVKETGLIDWAKSAEEIHNLVRGLNSTSVAYTNFNGEMFKIWRTKLLADRNDVPSGDFEVGSILKTDNNGIYVKTGDGVLLITEVQTPGKKKMSAKDYLRGHSITLPAKFKTY